MKRLPVLIQKELNQHKIPFICLSLFILLIFALQLIGTAVSPRSMGFLTTESSFLLVFIPLSATILGNRLVVKEYHGRTQLFIESLPISRVEMVLVKFFTGLAFLLFFTVFTLLIASGLSHRSDPVSGHFLLILLSRSTMFCYFVWSFLFAMGFTGRFRIPIYLLLTFSLIVINMTSELDITQEGPLALVMSDFPLERYRYPASQLYQTFFIGSGWLVLAFLISLINEGSVAESLAKPMSQREKAVIGVIIIGFMISASLLESKRVKEPYKFNSDAVITSETEPIEILYIDRNIKPDAIALNDHLENKISDLRNTLGLRKIPPVRIAFRDSLDKDKFETAKLISNDGILVRANFKDIDNWCMDDFTAYLTRAILDNITHNRTRFAPKQWLHDGFSCWWAHDGFSMDSALHKTLLLRSIFALKEQDLNQRVIKEWPVFRERFGEPVAEAVAYSGLAYIQSSMGSDPVINLVKQVFGRHIPNDSRETIHEILHPMPVIFEEQTGENWESFLTGWAGWLHNMAAVPEFQEKLAAIPEVSRSLEIFAKEGNIRDIVYEFNFSNIPDSGYICSLLHKKLSPFDSVISPEDLLREEKKFYKHTKSRQRHLTGKYNSGDRVFLALEYDSDILGVPIRILSRRMNIE
ncbi:MAG: ABC transporter permease [Desulfobacteraceae bacterium]|jgi:ABC-type transport system involved in multi-copper enzyme maturation permease subunit